MTDTLEKIIHAANQAPSGDNCQPWEFKIAKNNTILLHLLPHRDQSLYSWGNRASLLALGASIENAVIAGNHFGYSTSVRLLPNPGNPNLVAELVLSAGTEKEDPLYASIFNRCTNRKHYKKIRLTAEQKEYFISSGQAQAEGRVVIVEDAKDITILAKSACLNEKILFENQYMHKFFYSHINWTSREDSQKKMGFFVKTLEVPAYAMPSFKLAKNWKVLKWLNKFGFSNMIAKENSKTYISSAGIGAIIIPTNSQQNYLAAGRLLEKVWLKATQERLSLQPLTGICFLMQKVLNNSTEQLSVQHIKIIEEAYGKIKSIFGAENETIALLFRIGHGENPSGYTSRLPFQLIKKLTV